MNVWPEGIFEALFLLLLSLAMALLVYGSFEDLKRLYRFRSQILAADTKRHKFMRGVGANSVNHEFLLQVYDVVQGYESLNYEERSLFIVYDRRELWSLWASKIGFTMGRFLFTKEPFGGMTCIFEEQVLHQEALGEDRLNKVKDLRQKFLLLEVSNGRRGLLRIDP